MRIHYYPCNGDINDHAGTAHFAAYAGCTARQATGRVKGTARRGYLPIVMKGLWGGTQVADNVLIATVTAATPTPSLSFLFRYEAPLAGTLMRWFGTGGKYIYSTNAGDIQLDGSSSYTILYESEIKKDWHRMTLVANGTTTDVYLDGTFMRNVNRQFTLPAGELRLFAYSTNTFPGGCDLAEISIYNHALTLSEIQALAAADGENPASWSIRNDDGSDLGAGCLGLENGFTAGGYTGYSYFDIAQIAGLTRTKLWTNGESCRYGKMFPVPDLTEIHAFCKLYLESNVTMNANHSSPGYTFNIFNLQSIRNTVDIAANYICQVQAIWENPGAGYRLRRHRVIWYDSSNVAHNVDMPDADIPTNQEVSFRLYLKYNGAASIIQVWINGVQVIDISNADFTGKLSIKSLGMFPYQGVHLDLVDASNSYPIYMGTQYVGQSAYSESTGMTNKKNFLDMLRRSA